MDSFKMHKLQALFNTTAVMYTLGLYETQGYYPALIEQTDVIIFPVVPTIVRVKPKGTVKKNINLNPNSSANSNIAGMDDNTIEVVQNGTVILELFYSQRQFPDMDLNNYLNAVFAAFNGKQVIQNG